MTVKQLIVALTKVDPDTEVHVYAEDAPSGSVPIVGVDPYEGTTVLVIDR
jgi:hypothetical protein